MGSDQQGGGRQRELPHRNTYHLQAIQVDIRALWYLSHYHDCAGYRDRRHTGDVADQDGYCCMAAFEHCLRSSVPTAVVESWIDEVYVVVTVQRERV